MKQYESVFEFIVDKMTTSGFVDLTISQRYGYFTKNSLNTITRHGLVGDKVFIIIAFYWKDEILK